jgi:hypothetical protein
VYEKPASIKKHQNKLKWRSRKTLMIGNVLEPQEVSRSEVVVREVGTITFEFLVIAPFAIHVAKQWISFEIIAKCSIVNEIIKWTNLEDQMMLSKGLSVEVVPPPHFFVPLPQTLLKHFNLGSVFRAVRDEGTPVALWWWLNLLSSHLLGVDYAI